MEVVIDGHNLAYHLYFRQLPDPDLHLADKLIEDVTKYALYNGKTCLMVFDSNLVEEPASYGAPRDSVQWVFAKDADEEIRRRLAIIPNPHEVLVVSSDKQVYNFAHDLGFQVKRTWEFSDQITYWYRHGIPPWYIRLRRKYGGYRRRVREIYQRWKRWLKKRWL